MRQFNPQRFVSPTSFHLTPRAPSHSRLAPQPVAAKGSPGSSGSGRRGIDPPDTVTVREAGRILQKHMSTVRRLLQEGDLLAYRLSPRGRLLIVKDSLDLYLREEKAAHLFESEEREQVRNERRRRNDKIRDQWRKEAGTKNER